MTRLHGQARQLHRLVGGDAAARAQQDPCHSLSVPSETGLYGRSLDTVARLDLALRDLFERDREVVLGRRVHHRRRELLENPLAERVVVVVDLPRPLRTPRSRPRSASPRARADYRCGDRSSVLLSGWTDEPDSTVRPDGPSMLRTLPAQAATAHELDQLPRGAFDVVVDDHVPELAARPPAPRSATASRLAICSALSVPRPSRRRAEVLGRGRRDEHLDGVGHRLADLASALKLDLEHDAARRRASRGSTSERRVP